MRFSYVADKCVNGQGHFGKPRHSRMFKGHTVNKNKSLVITQNLGAHEWKNQPWILPRGDLLRPSLWIHQEKGAIQMTSARYHVETPSPSRYTACESLWYKGKETKMKYSFVCIYIWMYIEATQLYKQTKLRVVGMGFKTMVVSKGQPRCQEKGLPRWGAS